MLMYDKPQFSCYNLIVRLLLKLSAAASRQPCFWMTYTTAFLVDLE